MNFRLSINPAIEHGDYEISFTFPSLDELERAANNMADLLLFIQDEMKVMPDYSNMFIREKHEDGEWEEIEGTH